MDARALGRGGLALFAEALALDGRRSAFCADAFAAFSIATILPHRCERRAAPLAALDGRDRGRAADAGIRVGAPFHASPPLHFVGPIRIGFEQHVRACRVDSQAVRAVARP